MRIDLQTFHDGCLKADTGPGGERKIPEFKVEYTDDYAWYLQCPGCGMRVSTYLRRPE